MRPSKVGDVYIIPGYPVVWYTETVIGVHSDGTVTILFLDNMDGSLHIHRRKDINELGWELIHEGEDVCSDEGYKTS